MNLVKSSIEYLDVITNSLKDIDSLKIKILEFNEVSLCQ